MPLRVYQPMRIKLWWWRWFWFEGYSYDDALILLISENQTTLKNWEWKLKFSAWLKKETLQAFPLLTMLALQRQQRQQQKRKPKPHSSLTPHQIGYPQSTAASPQMLSSPRSRPKFYYHPYQLHTINAPLPALMSTQECWARTKLHILFIVYFLHSERGQWHCLRHTIRPSGLCSAHSYRERNAWRMWSSVRGRF